MEYEGRYNFREYRPLLIFCNKAFTFCREEFAQ